MKRTRSCTRTRAEPAPNPRRTDFRHPQVDLRSGNAAYIQTRENQCGKAQQ
jgi:hypothetical protein